MTKWGLPTYENKLHRRHFSVCDNRTKMQFELSQNYYCNMGYHVVVSKQTLYYYVYLKKQNLQRANCSQPERLGQSVRHILRPTVPHGTSLSVATTNLSLCAV